MAGTQNEKQILILGMCSLPMGTMERQLGNMAILIPTIELLREAMPGVSVRTSLQLSQAFCAAESITSVPIQSWYEPTLKAGAVTALAFCRILLWRACRKTLNVDARFLVRGGRFEEIEQADVVLDFSGDTIGDMAHPMHLLKHACETSIVAAFGKRLVLFAQSPGPFSSTFRRWLCRRILGKATVISTREPVAAATVLALRQDLPVVVTACPAFLLAPVDAGRLDKALATEGLSEKIRPRLGVTLTGFSFSRSLVGRDKYRLRRDAAEVAPIVEVLRHAIRDLGMDVVLIPHVFRALPDGSLIHGPDSSVTRQVRDMLCRKYPDAAKQIHMIEGCYGASLTKAIIGTCDLYLSGRLHAGVAALSQGIPTVLLAYSRKFLGFASLLSQGDLVSMAFEGEIDQQDLEAKLDRAWASREARGSRITQALTEVQELARLNARIVADLAGAGPPVCGKLESMLRRWQDESATRLARIGVPYPVSRRANE